jgi:hypothetical protein
VCVYLFLFVGLVGVIVPGVFSAYVAIFPGTRTVLSWSVQRARTGRIIIVSIWLVRAGIGGIERAHPPRPIAACFR